MQNVYQSSKDKLLLCPAWKRSGKINLIPRTGWSPKKWNHIKGSVLYSALDKDGRSSISA